MSDELGGAMDGDVPRVESELEQEALRVVLPFQRTAAAVHRLVQADPWVKGLPGRATVHAHTAAIWLVHDYGPNHQALPAYRIEEPEWWLPLKKGRARALTRQLVAGLRAAIAAEREEA